jgi:hypothetical protein
MTFDLHRYLIYFPLEYQLDIEQMARDSHHIDAERLTPLLYFDCTADLMRGEWGTIEDPT